MTDPRQADVSALLKRSLVAIDTLEAKLAAVEDARHEPIAIVGIGCRLPKDADSPEAFWERLRDGIDAVTEVPPERWDVDRFYDPDPDAPGKSYTRWGSFVPDVDRFDAAFFGISPREAVSMDPQQRVLLEVAWESLEHAGIAPASLAGSATAVYVGITTHDYAMELAEAIGSRNGDAYTPSGMAHSVAAGRLSYVLGLHGPNVAIDTACSSSLVAMHWAMQSLRRGEADLALAGGINLTLTADGSVLTSRARMMSFDGHCKTFDATADGYVRGEGCGMLVLKRLSDARRDGDRVLALLRGSALNQDGRSSGLTAPNGRAQEAVIRAALTDARLQPDDVSYVEAHGTGTPLGDPIEIKALNEVYGQRPRTRPLQVGSVKTNIGHLEAAAGVAGVIKTVLALQHRQIPPHLHLREPNPLIAWDESAVAVPTRLTAWDSPQGVPRRAGVSSFGFSGTNAHLILEEAPSTDAPAPAAPGPQLLVLSAQTPAALADQSRRLAAALAAPDAPPLADVAATLACGRSHFAERAALVAEDPEAARAGLSGLAAGDVPAGASRGRSAGSATPEIVFLYTGQGAQYPGMAHRLYEAQPVFRAAMDECARLLRPHLERPLLEVLFGGAETAALLDDTAYTQPALFAVEYALTCQWRAWGIEPTAVMGHSVGEYVAACIAGVFALEDGLRLIAARGRMMSALPRDGAMAAVFADEARVREALRGHEASLSVAATNGVQNTVVAGRSEVLDTVLAQLAAAGVESQRLKVSHAFHSPLMEPMLDAFEALAAGVRFGAPHIGLVSNLTGRLAGDEVCSAAYWRRHVREAVRFRESLESLQHDGYRVFVEIGPAPVLLGMAQRDGTPADTHWIGSLRKGRDDPAAMLDALGTLHVLGAQVDWPAVLGEAAPRRRAVLPTYPFQRERYWHDLGRSRSHLGARALRTAHPLLGGALSSPLNLYDSEIGVALQPWLHDHRIFEFTLFPATGFIELALAAGRELLATDSLALHELVLREALRLPDDANVQVQVVATPAGEGTLDIDVFSRPANRDADSAAWRRHASCRVKAGVGETAAAADLAAWRGRLAGSPMDVAAYYERLETQGAHYGPAFRAIRQAQGGPGEVLGEVRLTPEAAGTGTGMLLHPALLDACIQLVGTAVEWGGDASGNADDLCVPVGLGEVVLHRAGADAAWCRVTVDAPSAAGDTLRADLGLFDADGRPLAELRRLELQRTTRSALERVLGDAPPRDWLFEPSWQPRPAAPGALAPGRWMVLADAHGVGDALAQRLADAGAPVVRVRPGDALVCEGTDWTVVPDDASHWRRALAAAAAGPEPLAGIVALRALDAPPAPDAGPDGAAWMAVHRPLLAQTLALAQALADSSARLWIATRASQAVDGSQPDLVQAPLWGLAGVVASELPALHCVRVDLDAQTGPEDAQRLFDELRATDAEDRVAFRRGQRHVARLVPQSDAAAAQEEALCLEIAQRGTLENLMLKRAARVAPGPGQVEIRVHATGLNFRDVLNALGMYPGDPGPLGNECAGVVSAVGPGVDDLHVGDEVVAMVDRSFATWVVAPAVMTVRKPAAMSFADAATVPVTFLTAQYALRDLSRIEKGDRVLIHAITGGVGMAALQIALRAGAEVFGTAGTPAKRELARSLGAHHVADSRSLSFADDVRAASGGAGMDIVLNSLAGDFIPASLGLLRSGGRFVEIGKTGIWDAARVADAYPGVEYHPLYLGEVAAQRPLFVRDMLREVLADIGRGMLAALPHRDYPLERAEQAFRFMGQGQHTGKIVLTQDPAPTIRPDASYLVTGGLGGLGLACAGWLADEGARHLVLLGRRPPGAAASEAIDALRTRGVQVTALQVDVADRQALADVLGTLVASQPPLRGVLHAAGVVDDATLEELTMARFDGVMTPKVAGSWHLHTLTAGMPIDFFVMFSSGAALLGSPGQGNYAAANTFMDALAHLRRGRGQHALSINWGSWADVGMAAAVGEQHRRRWAALGLRMIAPHDGVRMLAQVLHASRVPQLAVLPLDRTRLPAGLAPFYALLQSARPAPEPATARPAAAPAADLLPRLAATDASQRCELLADFLADQVVKVLALGSVRVDRQRSLMELGMDSLMAMELRNRIQAATQVRVAVADLLKGPSVEQLASQVLAALPAASPAAVEAAPQPAVAPAWEEGSL